MATMIEFTSMTGALAVSILVSLLTGRLVLELLFRMITVNPQLAVVRSAVGIRAASENREISAGNAREFQIRRIV